MKTVSISFLLLVAFPVHLMAQDSSQQTSQPKVTPQYFVYSPKMIDAGSNHIIEPTNTSNRKSPNSEIKLSALKTDFVPSPLSFNNQASSDFVRVAKLQDESQIVLEPVVEPPKVSAGDFKSLNNVTRPTPGNTNPIVSEPAEPVVEAPTTERNFQEVFRQDASVEPERVSLDHIRMSQQGNSWDEKPSTMRNIVDNFSPGGEPFAQRSIVGNANFFGVDRNACCDEWEGFCNCSGGLKGNPGHLGNPFLRSKDNCDARKKVLGNGKARRAANGCGCPDCSN